MIVHTHVCNYCGDQTELPGRCEEDDMFNNTKGKVSKIFGVSLDITVQPIKSFDGYHRRNTVNKRQLTFCTKNCLMEYLKKNITDNCELEIPR